MPVRPAQSNASLYSLLFEVINAIAPPESWTPSPDEPRGADDLELEASLYPAGRWWEQLSKEAVESSPAEIFQGPAENNQRLNSSAAPSSAPGSRRAWEDNREESESVGIPYIPAKGRQDSKKLTQTYAGLFMPTGSNQG